MAIFTAPDPLDLSLIKQKPSIFLAGSIEQGTAENWQEAASLLLDYFGDFNILTPRRPVWDPKLIDNFSELEKQVTWELDGLDAVDVVLMYFDPATKSPISLLELGLLLGKKKPVVVYCPDGFWRSGNVAITCARHNVPHFKSFELAIQEAVEWLGQHSLQTPQYML